MNLRRVLWLSVLCLNSVLGCKTARTDDSDVRYLSASAESSVTNAALFLGMPTRDAWISNNLWPVRDAMALDPGFASNVVAHDNVSKAAALQHIREAAAKVSTDGTLLIMLAGHGSPNGFIQTHDYQFMNSSDLAAAIAEGRKNKGRFKRLVLFVFSCYSGNWVNGLTPLGASDAFARADSLDKQLFEMSSVTTDRTSLELAAGLSRSKGIYEQMLVASSQVYNQLSYGDFFGQTMGSAYKSLMATSKETARISDLLNHVARNTPSNQPQFRAYPEYEVLNDYLFKPSPTSARFETEIKNVDGEEVLAISVPKALKIAKVQICEGASAKCLTNPGSMITLVDDDTEQDSSKASFLLTDLRKLKANSNVSVLGFRDNDASSGAAPVVLNPDSDNDGVADRDDLCANTAEGAVIWQSGPYLGCTAGQVPRQTSGGQQPTANRRIGLTLDMFRSLYFDGSSLVVDGDGDGVDDEVDFCYPTAANATVIKTGKYAGCTGEEKAKREAMVASFTPAPTNGGSTQPGQDSDGDGIADADDRCSRTPAQSRSSIFRNGYWLGCAPGEYATK